MGGAFCQLSIDATDYFSSERVEQADLGRFDVEGGLVDAVERLGLGSAAERQFLATYPPELLERARRAVAYALSESPRIPLAFHFEYGRGYDVLVLAGVRPAGGLHLLFVGPEH